MKEYMFGKKINIDNLILKQVEDGNIDEVKNLLKKASFSIDYLDKNKNYFIMILNGNEIIGCGALTYYDKIAEVRSILIIKKYRHSGIGSIIVKNLIEKAKTDGLKKVYTRTYKKTKKFFLSLGFIEIPHEKKLDLFEECRNCNRYYNCLEIAMKKEIK